MRESTIIHAMSLVLTTLLPPAPIVAAPDTGAARILLPTDRTVLPIPEPKYPHSTVLDARKATPPPRFKVKAPADAPNVLILLLDDFGFGQSGSARRFRHGAHEPVLRARDHGHQNVWPSPKYSAAPEFPTANVRLARTSLSANTLKSRPAQPLGSQG